MKFIKSKTNCPHKKYNGNYTYCNKISNGIALIFNNTNQIIEWILRLRECINKTKESYIIIKPFFITRKKVSRAVRKTLRNSAKNWILDYTKTKTNDQLFEEILSGDLQKILSIKLKKIYPLSLCEIRMLEVKLPIIKTKEVKEEIKNVEEENIMKEEIKKIEKKEVKAKEVKKEKQIKKEK